MTKVPHFHALCRTNALYFQAYERGGGPGRGAGGPQPSAIGLGDAIAWLLRIISFGHTRELAKLSVWLDRVIERLTFGWIKANANGTCKCAARRAWLNRYRIWTMRRPSWRCRNAAKTKIH
jgi:hypothetical protein